MSEEEGIQINISAEDEFSEAFSSAQESLSEFSNSIAGLGEAESAMETDSNEAISAINQVAQAQTEAATSTNELAQSAQESGASFSGSMTGIMGVTSAVGLATTATIGLGDAFLQNQDAQLKLQNAQDNLTKAQNSYNLAVSEYGPNSVQAQNALLSLQNAQNNLTEAQNRAQMSSESLDESVLQYGTMTIPMLLSKGPDIIAFLTGYGAETDALTLSQVAQSAASGIATGAMALFDAVMDANPIVLVVLAIGGLVAGLAYLTDGFKNFGPLQTDFTDAWDDMKTAMSDVMNFIQSDVYPVLDDLYKTYIEPVISAVDDLSKVGSDIESLFGIKSSSSSSSSSASTSTTGVESTPTAEMSQGLSTQQLLGLETSTQTSETDVNQGISQYTNLLTEAANAGNDQLAQTYQNQLSALQQLSAELANESNMLKSNNFSTADLAAIQNQIQQTSNQITTNTTTAQTLTINLNNQQLIQGNADATNAAQEIVTAIAQNLNQGY